MDKFTTRQLINGIVIVRNGQEYWDGELWSQDLVDAKIFKTKEAAQRAFRTEVKK